LATRDIFRIFTMLMQLSITIKIKVMHVVDNLDTLMQKYSDGKITLDQYYSGLADLSFMKSHPGATYDGKQVTINN
jgi:hypothetical protein